ncbi:hypothetical protein M413DRAFT_445608 [Hebeloma cylindrosporum]|uniref:Uncharacterized protein n=1 Tax=Hebeloma cylindrosporum TaxID=76867 RepID=A0A0C3CDH9_HEBCY|nr:hypothetical protein M413DRAFT_445608 [Hebeloma cylindrosporum h7]
MWNQFYVPSRMLLKNLLTPYTSYGEDCGLPTMTGALLYFAITNMPMTHLMEPVQVDVHW